LEHRQIHHFAYKFVYRIELPRYIDQDLRLLFPQFVGGVQSSKGHGEHYVIMKLQICQSCGIFPIYSDEKS